MAMANGGGGVPGSCVSNYAKLISLDKLLIGWWVTSRSWVGHCDYNQPKYSPILRSCWLSSEVTIIMWIVVEFLLSFSQNKHDSRENHDRIVFHSRA